MLWLLRFGGGNKITDHDYTRVLVWFCWLATISEWVLPCSSELEASVALGRAGTPGSKEHDAFESGIGKSSIWNHSPSSSEPTPEWLCCAIFVVAIDLGLGFGLGLDTLGTYGTIFIGKEGAKKEVLQEEAIFSLWKSGDFSGRKEFNRSSSLRTEGCFICRSRHCRPRTACINAAPIAEMVVVAQRAAQGRSPQGGRMNSKSVGIGVSERTASRSPKRHGWAHRIKSQPSPSDHWLANGSHNLIVRVFQLSEDPYHI